MGNITSLGPNEVFVFGSNEQGFHGAGAAGFAFRGTSANTWRDDVAFREAMNSRQGSPLRVGKWAVYGVSRGYQVGRSGRSYAVCTITRPGSLRSVSLADIKTQLIELAKFAKLHPELCFLCSKIGCGYSGYSEQEVLSIWPDMPNNVISPWR